MQNRLREKWKIRVMSLRTMLESQCDSEQKYCNGERRIYLEILRLSKCKYGQSHPPERKRDNDNDITFKQANWKWLSHASSVHQAITFANTLFPCFVSTSGLATTRTKKIKHKDRASRLIKRALFRAGSISAWEQPFEFQVPSVLGTIRISSIVCDLESYYSIKPPILPAILGLSWYMVSRLRPFEPVHSSSQAWLDQQVYGSSHLYELVHGFDPEGVLSALLTLAGLGFLGSLLTGLLPSPASKLLWTPTFNCKQSLQSNFINLIQLISAPWVDRFPNSITANNCKNLLKGPLADAQANNQEVHYSGNHHDIDTTFFILDELNANGISTSPGKNSLILDSGASKTTLCDFNLLIDPQPIAKSINTYSGRTRITHVRKFNLGGTLIYPVFYAPDGPRNLVSLSQLEDHGLTTVFKNRLILVCLGRKVVFWFPRVGNLYQGQAPRQNSCNYAMNISDPDPDLDYHILLGHPSDAYLVRFFKLYGIFPTNQNQAARNCEAANYASTLINILPSKALNWSSPVSVLAGLNLCIEPVRDINKMVPFGLKVHVSHRPPSTISTPSRPLICLGHEKHSEALRFFDPTRRHVVISQDYSPTKVHFQYHSPEALKKPLDTLPRVIPDSKPSCVSASQVPLTSESTNLYNTPLVSWPPKPANQLLPPSTSGNQISQLVSSDRARSTMVPVLSGLTATRKSVPLTKKTTSFNAGEKGNLGLVDQPPKKTIIGSDVNRTYPQDQLMLLNVDLPHEHDFVKDTISLEQPLSNLERRLTWRRYETKETNLLRSIDTDIKPPDGISRILTSKRNECRSQNLGFTLDRKEDDIVNPARALSPSDFQNTESDNDPPVDQDSALEMLGQRSLEVYLISAGVALGLEGIGIRDIIYQLINNLLIPIGFHDDHQRGQITLS
ncbi:hypothetical protein MJO28_009705 [Puccinia striiformis f. sp. tritici]|uniref:Uncharacterized protein n=1 Tax=Puccinia striiformis f. sp. tritici TaxID=168172 RepID=A0ACC0E9B5_9BASI|nr:hypothetical protein MJO28_009705 [Puccinia striiformis f. sp. tritici]